MVAIQRNCAMHQEYRRKIPSSYERRYPTRNCVPLCRSQSGHAGGYRHAAESGADEIAEAVAKATAAQVRWAATPVRDRIRILTRFAELLCDQKDSVAAVISREAGKPEAEALSTEVLVVLDTVKYLPNHVAAFLRPEPVPHGIP